MSYLVNPGAWQKMFAVPSEIVDKHIRLAGSLQLKVLLVILRYSAEGIDAEKISEILKTDKADVSDAMHYWAENGILFESGEAPKAFPEPEKRETAAAAAAETKKEELPKRAEPQRKMPLPEIKPDIEQIASRCEECPELRYLYSEAQIKLGRTIGYDGQASLLMLHDNYGLPVEVILMIIGYCMSIDKKAMSYILKVGKSWAEKEIDTLEKAESEIARLSAMKTLWVKFKSLTGIPNPLPTAKQRDYLVKWNTVWGFSCDMIYLAYEEMVDHTEKISFPYMDKILESWRENGITTPQLVMKAKQERAQNTNNKKTASKPSGSQPSYDVDEFIKRAMRGAGGAV